MFTGLIEEIGTIADTKEVGAGLDIKIGCTTVLEGTQVGDSICVDGVCLTVTELIPGGFKTSLSPETLRVTNLSKFQIGQRVNLERSLTLQSRLGGHMVQGHVDGIAEVIEITVQGDCQIWKFSAPANLLVTAIYKGSITVNGVSLTISDLTDSSFSVALIPKTLEMTTFPFLKAGNQVNIECDMFGKYIYKYLQEMKSAGSNLSV